MEYTSVIYPVDYSPKRPLTITQVYDEVSIYFCIKDFSKKTNKREFVYPRQIFCYVCRKRSLDTLKNIAGKIGGKHHATVVNAVNTIQDLMDTDEKVRDDVKRIMDILNNKQ